MFTVERMNLRDRDPVLLDALLGRAGQISSPPITTLNGGFRKCEGDSLSTNW